MTRPWSFAGPAAAGTRRRVEVVEMAVRTTAVELRRLRGTHQRVPAGSPRRRIRPDLALPPVEAAAA